MKSLVALALLQVSNAVLQILYVDLMHQSIIPNPAQGSTLGTNKNNAIINAIKINLVVKLMSNE